MNDGKNFITNFRNARLNPFAQSSPKSLITRGDMQKARRQDAPSSFINRYRAEGSMDTSESPSVPKAPTFKYKTTTTTEEKAPITTEVKISKSPKYSFKAVSERNLKDLENRQSRDFNKNMPNSRYYNYIPFSFEDEVGTQYGLIQTPSFARNEITGVFLDNGYSLGPDDAMDFISSAKDSIFVPPTNNFSYPYFSGYGDEQYAPANWLQEMRRRYLKNNPNSAYSQRTMDSINRYEQTGRL